MKNYQDSSIKYFIGNLALTGWVQIFYFITWYKFISIGKIVEVLKMKRYEMIDHTADIGIKVFGKDIKEIFSNAGYAMFDILTDPKKIEKKEIFNIQVSANNIEELLVKWLDELLYRYETERVIFNEFIIDKISDTEINSTVYGERIDHRRHEIKTEIKNVTYHQLQVKKTDKGWEAQVIFDV